MIISVHRTTDETLRLHEYSPGFDPQRFEAHERFFVEDVSQWARSHLGVELPKERTAVFGVSPGAGYRPPSVMPSPLPRVYLVAGTLEPFFRENATRWADALRGAGTDVVMTEREGSHGDAFWRAELPLMVAWAFGRAYPR
jgi:hypothetical protein